LYQEREISLMLFEIDRTKMIRPFYLEARMNTMTSNASYPLVHVSKATRQMAYPGGGTKDPLMGGGPKKANLVSIVHPRNAVIEDSRNTMRSIVRPGRHFCVCRRKAY
jgi:hypothetical protein